MINPVTPWTSVVQADIINGTLLFTETSLGETVGGQWPEIGFEFHVNGKNVFPCSKRILNSAVYP